MFIPLVFLPETRRLVIEQSLTQPSTVVEKLWMPKIEHASHLLARISLRSPFLVLVGPDQPYNWLERARLACCADWNKRSERETTLLTREMLKPFGCVEVIGDERKRYCIDC
ncbi:hypothetical protein JCGZ_20001 [Jatropha curcas]|uniref:Uncharacterized protein n=1 Tax=Jatropha curcas TaxID=180498 RepID=A0A067JXX3_JATCU|nr:hypothetical protein JCGZ_20001 [Jatropha curcas]